ncbi:MAG: HpcH/HpaI aldolase/citrate lyase family protein [Anaerolineae bacterium]
MSQRLILRRSLLYVPGDREAMLAKAPSRGADSLILNLEDAVAPANKDAAREIIARSLATLDFTGVEVIVRVNPLETATGYRDLLAVAPAGPDAILLPKVSSAEVVRFAAWALAREESNAGLPAGRIRVMCMIESAAGVVAAPQIAACDPRVTALIFGANDLAEDLGCAPTPGEGILLHAACQVVLAARAAGVDAIDTPHMNIHDLEGLSRSAALARDLGFAGKSAIHPNQVAAINAVFVPTPEQVSWAERVLALVPDGDESAVGAAVLDSQLIEAPHVARARRILAASAIYFSGSRL